jgi:SRSO17 transposase
VRTSPDDEGAFREVKRCHQRIIHCIGRAEWDDTPVRDEAVRFARESLPDDEPIEQIIIDDTGFLKQGTHSAGVKRQYTGSAGKKTNCQVGVSLVACTATAQFPVDFALYLPSEWLTPAAREYARIPDSVVFTTKPELAAQMVERVLDTGLLPVCRISADCAYGHSTAFREAMLDLGCSLAVGVKGDAHAWSVDARGLRRGPATSVSALAERLKYRRVVWRNGTKGRMAGLFGARRVAMKNGFDPEDPSEPLWLVAEKVSAGLKFHLVSGGPNAKLKDLVGVLKQRFRTERAYQDANNEVGLADYQGRSFVGWHHHVTAAIAACAFLFSEQRRIPGTPNTSSRRKAVRTSTRLLRHFPESFPTLRRAITAVLRVILPGQPSPCLA